MAAATTTPSALILIPARMGARRLPGKPLAEIAGRPLVQHVYALAREVPGARVIVATPDAEIQAVAQGFGALVALTSPDCPSGSHRCAQALAGLGEAAADVDVVVNLQGDEPLLDPRAITALIAALRADPGVGAATLACPLTDGPTWRSPHVVKVLMDGRGRALAFSRAPVPWHRGEGAPPGALRHIGVYAFRPDVLLGLPHLAPTAWDAAEDLEQLRLLWHGVAMGVVVVAPQPGGVSTPGVSTPGVDTPGVDTPEDLERVRAILEARR